MSKRKKKPNLYSLRKLAEAQHRNKFLRNVKRICNLSLGHGVYHLIPQSGLQLMAAIRPHAINIVAAQGHSIPPEMLDSARYNISKLLKQQTVAIYEGGPEMSVDEFLDEGLCLFMYIEALKNETFPAAARLKQILEKAFNTRDFYLRAYERLNAILQFYCLCTGDLEGTMYWGVYKFELSEGMKRRVCQRFEIHSYSPERIAIKIDGHTRIATRVSLPLLEKGAITAQIDPRDIGIRLAATNTMEVYIQSHALKRLSERIDCLYPGLAQLALFAAFHQPVYFRNDNGVLFIEYQLEFVKAGYFVCDIKDGKLIVRTFLFLTNDGTPEAKRLKALAGIVRRDKEYLEIDKLSAFVRSDLSSDERLKKLFNDAGCGSLIQLHHRLQYIAKAGQEFANAARIIRYLGLDRKVLKKEAV
jgi:hypothetical protein